MPQFFGQRPLQTQPSLLGALPSGVNAGTQMAQSKLAQLQMLARGAGAMGQALGGTPQYRQEMRQNERQDELIKKQREEKEKADNFNTALTLKVDPSYIEKAKSGEISMQDLIDEVTVRNPPSVRKLMDEKEEARKYELDRSRRETERATRRGEDFEGLAEMLIKSGLSTEETAGTDAARVMLQKFGAIREAEEKEGLKFPDALKAAGTVDGAIALMEMDDSTRTGRELPPPVMEILRGFKTPEAQRVEQGKKRLEIYEKRVKEMSARDKEIAALRNAEREVKAKRAKLIQERADAKVLAASYTEGIRAKTATAAKIESAILRAESELAEARGVGLAELTRESEEHVSSLKRQLTDVRAEIKKDQEERDKILVGAGEPAAGEGETDVEDAFGED